MLYDFLLNTPAWLLVLVLLMLMLLSIYIGHRLGRNKEKPKGSSSIIASVYALSAFILAFTFGLSANRFDARRNMIIKEANDIGTAILRADIYSDDQRAAFREDFKQYLETRIAYYDGKTIADKLKAIEQGAACQKRLWARASLLGHNKENLIPSAQMIPALNNMFDTASARTAGEKDKVPGTIILMLFMLTIASAFFAGYASEKIDWLPAIGSCILSAFVIFTTLDLDRPYRGFIQLTISEENITGLRELLK